MEEIVAVMTEELDRKVNSFVGMPIRVFTFSKSFMPALSSLDKVGTLEFQADMLSLLQNMWAKKRGLADNYKMSMRTLAT